MRRLLVSLAAALLAACGSPDGRPEVWIYTSIYPSVIERMTPALEAAFPEVRIRWYQKGSEQVAARLNMEIEAGETPCDLLMTSDPFYYAALKERGWLLPYESPAARDVPAGLRDADHVFVTVRIPVMVIGVNTRELDEADWPRGFSDLAAPALADQVSMGDPLKSGTNFTTVAALAHRYGWELLEAWSANGIVAAGGNSAVLQRLETGERPVGVILLENLLPRLAKDAPLAVVYPADGAVPVPSPIAILRSTEHPEAARRIYDFMFSDTMQEAVVAGHMYSPLPGALPPAGGAAWEDLALLPWDDAFVDWVRGQRGEIKRRFRMIMRRQ